MQRSVSDCDIKIWVARRGVLAIFYLLPLSIFLTYSGLTDRGACGMAIVEF